MCWGNLIFTILKKKEIFGYFASALGYEKNFKIKWEIMNEKNMNNVLKLEEK